VLTIWLVDDRDAIWCWYLSDAAREIILLLFGDTSPIRGGVARDDYYIIIFWHVIAYEASGGVHGILFGFGCH